MNARNVRLARLSLLLTCVVWSGLCASQTTPELVAAYYDSISLSGKLQGAVKDNFVVEMTCTRYRKGTGKATGSNSYFGTDGYDPQCVLSTLRMKLNGKAVSFPKSSYADLADVHVATTIYLSTRGNTVVLHARGGDGVASYKVRFLIEERALVGREIERMNDKEEVELIRQKY